MCSKRRKSSRSCGAKKIEVSILVDELVKITGGKYVYAGENADPAYGKDQSAYPAFPYDVLIKPGTLEEVSAIARVCTMCRVPLTVRGGGTGVTGGALPVRGGVVLSIERLNHIIDIDPDNRYAVVEAGVITSVFCDALEARGMYFPVAPGSMGSSMIGGNLAANAGSPRSCKYGSIENQVLNLEVVLAGGEVIQTGSNVHKNAAGFNLTRLLVGSQGMLGIITKAVLKIGPLPVWRKTFLAGYCNLQAACNACLQIAGSGLRACAVELITEGALRLAAPFASPGYPLLAPPVCAHLLIELEGYDFEDSQEQTEKLAGLLACTSLEDIVVGESVQERSVLWSLREKIGVAMTSHGLNYRDIDICVPPARLYAFLTATEEIGNTYGETLITFGHAMDGNMHTMLLLRKEMSALSDRGKVLTALYSTAIRLGGTITGEHGIGLLQQEFQYLQFPSGHLELLQRIKHAFDPHCILNPGKL
jgi:glycolate oxidase